MSHPIWGLALAVTVAGCSLPSGLSSGQEQSALETDASCGTTSFDPIRVAAGESAAVVDTQGNVWSADIGFSAGTALVEPQAIPIAGTDSPVLYNAERYGAGSSAFQYAFTVPNGNYAVTLKFAESFVTGPQERQFDVVINGDRVEAGFDIFAAAGAMNTAVDRQYAVSVANDKLEIDFTPGSIQNPKIDAIEIAQSASGNTGSDAGSTDVATAPDAASRSDAVAGPDATVTPDAAATPDASVGRPLTTHGGQGIGIAFPSEQSASGAGLAWSANGVYSADDAVGSPSYKDPDAATVIARLATLKVNNIAIEWHSNGPDAAGNLGPTDGTDCKAGYVNVVALAGQAGISDIVLKMNFMDAGTRGAYLPADHAVFFADLESIILQLLSDLEPVAAANGAHFTGVVSTSEMNALAADPAAVPYWQDLVAAIHAGYPNVLWVGNMTAGAPGSGGSAMPPDAYFQAFDVIAYDSYEPSMLPGEVAADGTGMPDVATLASRYNQQARGGSNNYIATAYAPYACQFDFMRALSKKFDKRAVLNECGITRNWDGLWQPWAVGDNPSTAVDIEAQRRFTAAYLQAFLDPAQADWFGGFFGAWANAPVVDLKDGWEGTGGYDLWPFAAFAEFQPYTGGTVDYSSAPGGKNYGLAP